MTGRLRVVDTGGASGRWNTALSAALMHCGSGTPGEACLRFYRFAPCLLLGASQPYPTGPSLAHVSAARIEVARRVTGGGTVYMSPSMLAWDVVMRQSQSADSVALACSAALAAALRALGYADVTSSATGLAIAGRKISGAALGSDRGIVLYQGTLLIADETAAMAAALGCPTAALAPHVTCLRAHGALPEATQLHATIAAHLAAAFARVAAPATLTPQEQAFAAREHAREIGTDTFVRGEDMDAAGRACA